MGIAGLGRPLHQRQQISHVLVHPKVLGDIEPALEAETAGGEAERRDKNRDAGQERAPPGPHARSWCCFDSALSRGFGEGNSLRLLFFRSPHPQQFDSLHSLAYRFGPARAFLSAEMDNIKQATKAYERWVS